MPESFDAIDPKNRYFKTVARKQHGITFDIDLFQAVKIRAPGAAHLCFHFFTEMTAWL